MLVKATREKLEGHRTATGWIIDKSTPFVALPSSKALHRRVRVTNPLNGKTCDATVLDVGPWSEQDDIYVFGNSRPLAESNQRKMMGRPLESHQTNGAGIDLGERLWLTLEMRDNTEVDWVFIDDPSNTI